MSDEQASIQTITQSRTPPDGYGTWNGYWTKEHNQPWRTEPEIDEERKSYLDERRAMQTDIETGIYPFRDSNGSIMLTRADMEWLLVTHDGGRGPVFWEEEVLKPEGQRRWGVDVRGANLREVNLSGLPLARLQAGLRFRESTTAEQREIAAANVERAKLQDAHLEGAYLRNVHLERAKLRRAHLQGARLARANLQMADLRDTNLSGVSFWKANLEGAHLQRAFLAGGAVDNKGVFKQGTPQEPSTTRILPCDLRRASLDTHTELDGAILGSAKVDSVILADVRWGGAVLSSIDWTPVATLGDEYKARRSRSASGAKKNSRTRVWEYTGAARANRQLADALRAEGLNDHADRFDYRAQVLRGVVLFRQRHYLRWLGSSLLWLVAGYGYRPLRSFITYALVILGFAAAYLFLGDSNGISLPWNEAIVVSMTAFHGRGFFSAVFQPGDLQAAIAAVEAFIGLLIEIIFIATFTQRFFAR